MVGCLSLSLPSFEHQDPPAQLWRVIREQLGAYVDLLEASTGVLLADQKSKRGDRSVELLRKLDVSSSLRRLGEELASAQWALTS